MSKVTVFVDELNKKEYAIIDNGDGSFTSMLKSIYDEQQAEAKAPKVVDETTPL